MILQGHECPPNVAASVTHRPDGRHNAWDVMFLDFGDYTWWAGGPGLSSGLPTMMRDSSGQMHFSA